jgi:hypothetical protein
VSLTNAQYNSIMKGYEQTRDRNRHLAEQRRREIYTKLPEYGRLDESVGELSVAQAKLLLNGDDEALTRLRSSLKEISRQKRELLTSAGYPADIYAARETDTLGISSETLQTEIRALGHECYYFPSFDEIENFLLENCINGDLLITMGAGDVVKIGENLLGK